MIVRTVTPRYALAHRIRWRIFGMLFGFGCIAYLQQKSLTVAAERMMPDLGLTQMQIGWLEWAFVLGYAAFQLPGGVIGQRLGARRMFTLISIVAFLATILTPLAPLVLSGTALFAALLLLQLLLGLAQGPIFPVSSGVMEAWFRPERWALLQGLQSMGLQLAAALTPPARRLSHGFVGWQRALFWPALPALVLIGVWAWYGRNTPAEHPAVTARGAERARRGLGRASAGGDFLAAPRAPRSQPLDHATHLVLCMHELCLLSDRQLVLPLSCARAPLQHPGGWLARRDAAACGRSRCGNRR